MEGNPIVGRAQTQQCRWSAETCEVDFMFRPDVKSENPESQHRHLQAQSQQRSLVGQTRHPRLHVEAVERRSSWGGRENPDVLVVIDEMHMTRKKRT